jgi:hypothetical protein
MGKGDPKGGRPEFVLSPEEYEKLIAMIRIQCTQEEICGIYGGIDHKTLNKAIKAHGGVGFSHLYKKHSDEGKASLRRSQWKAAQDGNPTMLVWLGKQMLGQRDKHDIDANLSGDLNVTKIERRIVSPDN